MNAEHIAQARRLAADAAVANVDFRVADFATSNAVAERFDYILAHGVYSWVGARTQAEIRGFIDRHLKPGGLVYVSYNALPGWLAELPFQRLLRAFAQPLPGNSVERISGALAAVRDLAAAGLPVLKESTMFGEISKHPGRYPLAYLAHEYLGAAWQPLWVTEVRQAMASIGLSPVGSATLRDNYDSLVLGRRARDAIDAIGVGDVREIARDCFIKQSFRRDIFIRDGQPVDEGERRRRLLASCFALGLPAEKIEYEMETPAGRVRFNNAASRALVASLATGPARLAEIAERSEIGARDLLANTLVLAASGAIRPVEATRQPVAALNRAICDRRGGAEAIQHLALPCGTALRVEADLLSALGATGALDPDRFPGWGDLLAAHGV
jgi:SAM-dependent methyltransferase